MGSFLKNKNYAIHTPFMARKLN